MKPKISIIIPALNEEKDICTLLKSIKAQKFPCEIIVADAGSTDRTVKIARKYGARIASGGLPAVGRNLGAKAAKSDLLLFLDADMTLKKNFLNYSYDKIKKKKMEAVACMIFPAGRNLFDIALYSFANLWIKSLEGIKPYAHGCIFASKKVHDKIGGFDEKITFGEDSDYVKRAGKLARFGIINKYVYFSPRRMKTEGRLNSLIKYAYLNGIRLINGEIKKEVNYKFGHY